MNFKISKNKTLYIFRRNFDWTPKYFDNSPNKFITNNAIWGINLLWWQFMIEDDNYSNRYIHVCLDENNRDSYSKNIRIFMDVLKLWWESGKVAQYPFIINYKNKKFYITCSDRNWFIKHQLGSILQQTYPEYYMDEEELKIFPKL
jgi:hypothetical protein